MKSLVEWKKVSIFANVIENGRFAMEESRNKKIV